MILLVTDISTLLYRRAELTIAVLSNKRKAGFILCSKYQNLPCHLVPSQNGRGTAAGIGDIRTLYLYVLFDMGVRICKGKFCTFVGEERRLTVTNK
jgi:hypothetical protein